MKFSIREYLGFTESEIRQAILKENARMSFQKLVQMSKNIETSPGIVTRRVLTH